MLIGNEDMTRYMRNMNKEQRFYKNRNIISNIN